MAHLLSDSLQNKVLIKAVGTGFYGSGCIASARCGGRSVVAVSFYENDVHSWADPILRHVKSGQFRQALLIYDRMREVGMELSAYTFVAALKACGGLEDLARAHEIHNEVVKSGLETSVHIGNMLVHAYAKCGSLVHARRVFERMPQRTVVSWNTMILAYAQMKQGQEALQLYAEMRRRSIAPSERTFVAVLKACQSFVSLEDWNETNDTVVTQCLHTVRAIHSDILNSTSGLNVYVGTMLVDVYAKCESIEDARKIFDKLSQRNVVSFTAMMFGYVQVKQAEEALNLYAQMQVERVQPNNRTFIAALKACSSLASLINELDVDDIALRKRCLERIRSIHSQIVENACESDLFVGTMLVDVYAKCGSLLAARAVFDQIPHRNVVCWTAMILGYANMKQADASLQLYAQMQQEGVEPDEHAFVGALKACCSLVAGARGCESEKNVIRRCLLEVKAIHSHVAKLGCQSSLYVGNMLVDVYAKCGSLQDARQVFEKIPNRNVVLWNSIIMGYAQSGQGEEALRLYLRMVQDGVTPDDRTFVGAIKACGSLTTRAAGCEQVGASWTRQCLDKVMAIHSDILRTGNALGVFVGNMLVDVYAKCGRLDEARCVFENITHRTVVSWNAMIMGYAQIEDGEEALRMYTRMQEQCVSPDDVTFIGALKACSTVAALEKGREIHARISVVGLKLTDSYLPATLIDMYGKCGSMFDAQQVFDSLATRDVVTWSALLAGYAHRGDFKIVFDLFQKMGQDGIKPNSVTLLSLLTVCSHAGLLDTGQKYFDTMGGNDGIPRALDHYTCMVDLLGRAGQVDEAMALARSMPCEPDSALWLTVLGACRKWGKVDQGKQAFERAIMLDRNDAAAYDLMANIYASSHMWESMTEVQSMREQAGTWRRPGRSFIVINGIVHTFMVGDEEYAYCL